MTTTKKTATVEIIDKDHIYVDGNQFISLKRFYENKKEVADEVLLLNNKVEELTKKVEALKVLVKIDEI